MRRPPSLGGLQLVYDFAGNAAKHHELRGKFLQIMAKAEAPDADVGDLSRSMVAIYSDEPEIYHAVNFMAYNAAQAAFDRPDKEPVKVGWIRALLRHWMTFSPSDFKDTSRTSPAGP